MIHSNQSKSYDKMSSSMLWEKNCVRIALKRITKSKLAVKNIHGS